MVSVLTLGLLAAFAFVLLPAEHDWSELGIVWAGLVALVAIGRWIELDQSQIIGHVFQLIGVFCLLCLLGSLAQSVLATTSLPTADAFLARIDAKIGFDWLLTFHTWQAVPGVFLALSLVYSSLTWQPVLLISLLAAGNRVEDAWRFLTAWGISLLAVTLIFPFFPAYANFAVLKIAPSDAPDIMVSAGWAFAKNFDALRDGSTVLIGREHLDGLVTFPSFHASAGILLAAGFASLRRWAWPFCILNALMVVSAVFVGAHYLVDILVGILVALAGWLAAQRFVPIRRV